MGLKRQVGFYGLMTVTVKTTAFLNWKAADFSEITEFIY
jgi:hypothetical protein